MKALSHHDMCHTGVENIKIDEINFISSGITQNM